MKSAFSATRMAIARRVVTVVGAGALVLGGVSACSDETADSAASAVASATDDAKDNAAKATSKAKEASEETKDDVAAATSEAKAKAEKLDDKEYDMDEVKRHNKADDCWSVIDGDVYDLTDWVHQHPGGADKVEQLCGTDGTAMFEGHHGGDDHPHDKIKSFKIGELDD